MIGWYWRVNHALFDGKDRLILTS